MGLPFNGIWKTGTSMPTGRNNFECACIGKKIYCAGGLISPDYGATNVLEIYDTESEYWMTARPMPVSLGAMGSAIVGNKLYCIGGVNAIGISNSIYIYDTDTNSWSTSPYSLPSARFALRCCCAEGKIYCIGGITDKTRVYTDLLEILDLETGIWTTGSPLPVKLGYGCLHYNNGQLYWIGGGGTPETINSKKTYIYDIVNDSWAEGYSLSLNRLNYASKVNDEKIYIIGGTDYDAMKDFNTFSAYDMKNDAYITLPSMPIAPGASGTEIVNGKLYVIGGRTSVIYENYVYIYSSESPDSPLPPAPDHLCCCGELDIHLKLPITNNQEVLRELNSLIPKLKSCDRYHFIDSD